VAAFAEAFASAAEASVLGALEGCGAAVACASAVVGCAGGFRGGGRRSDIALKHDIELLGRLDSGIGFYRFSYNGSDKAYVGVIAQEIQAIVPDAVVRGPDGYLRVFYGKLGVPFQTYDQWIAPAHMSPRGVRTD
jgi:Chaperone of endosialidase